MSAQPNDEPELPRHALAPAPGEWRPARPHSPRTPKQRKRELRKDRHRRRRISERARHDPTLTDFEVRVLDGYLWHSDDSAAPVFPGVATVAAAVHGHPRSIRRCVAQLEVAGYMERFMRPVDQARNRSNMYYFREPAGPIVDHRPNQRRRSRKRRSDTRTGETAGTPSGVNEPPAAGAAKPAPPPRKPGWRRDLPPSRTLPAQPKPFPSLPPAPPPDESSRTASITALQDARAVLDALKAQHRRP
jgi:hypothetical protein